MHETLQGASSESVSLPQSPGMKQSIVSIIFICALFERKGTKKSAHIGRLR
jgi:hypothetical protein